MRIKGAGLVHDPALELTALARDEGPEEDAAPALARIAEALGLEEDATETAILAAISQTNTPDPARFMPVAWARAPMGELGERTVQRRELQARVTIDDAVSNGRMPPFLRDRATKLFMADPKAFETFAEETDEKCVDPGTPIDRPEDTSGTAESRSIEADIARQLGDTEPGCGRFVLLPQLHRPHDLKGPAP